MQHWQIGNKDITRAINMEDEITFALEEPSSGLCVIGSNSPRSRLIGNQQCRMILGLITSCILPLLLNNFFPDDLISS